MTSRAGPRSLSIVLLIAVWLPAARAAPPDAWDHPFAATSPWNTRLGGTARFAGLADPRTRDVLAGHALIHAGAWGMALWRARPGDPWVTVTDQENRRSFRIQAPPAARPDPMADGHMFVGNPDGTQVLEMYRAQPGADGTIRARRAFMVDLRGQGMFLRDGRFPGVRAMDASGLGGVLRAWEVRAGRIDHALTFLLPPGRLRHGPVWPSSREDYWGFRDYTGHVPIGTLVAIPRGVDLAALRLTPPGLALARALQEYGAYCDDSAGTDGLVITAENAAEGLPALAAMRADMPRIRAALRVVVTR